MTALAIRTHPGKGLLLPALLLCLLGGVIGAQTGVLRLSGRADQGLAPQITTIAPRTFSYRSGGDFLQHDRPTDAPLIELTPAGPLDIMTYQVSTSDYARCVDAAACKRAEPRRKVEAAVPATGVSYNDAADYARWLSDRTGQTWRLPSIEEWAFAAGSRVVDNGLGKDADAGNPADRWLARYELENAPGSAESAKPLPRGTFGFNELGVADFGGNVWEWTATCNSRTRLDATGGVVSRLDSCGVRLLEGRHRTAMSAFIRDGRGGGCSAGAPPDNLGFRLVRERPWYAPMLAWIGRVRI